MRCGALHPCKQRARLLGARACANVRVCGQVLCASAGATQSAARQLSAPGIGQGRPTSGARGGAGSTTRLLRSDAAQEATLADAADYVPRLAAAARATSGRARRRGARPEAARVKRLWARGGCTVSVADSATIFLQYDVWSACAWLSESGALRSRPGAAAAPDVVRSAALPARHGPGPQAAAAAAGGAVPESARGELLQEVAALVEAPTVLAGAFDAAFLALPRRVGVLAG